MCTYQEWQGFSSDVWGFTVESLHYLHVILQLPVTYKSVWCNLNFHLFDTEDAVVEIRLYSSVLSLHCGTLKYAQASMESNTPDSSSFQWCSPHIRASRNSGKRKATAERKPNEGMFAVMQETWQTWKKVLWFDSNGFLPSSRKITLNVQTELQLGGEGMILSKPNL